MNRKVALETLAAQAGGQMDRETGAIVSPIHVATTFVRDPDQPSPRGLRYARPDSPTTREGETVLAALEGGTAGLLFSSGMAAATTAFLALERPAHVVAPEVMYWGLRKWLEDDAPALGIETTLVDARRLDAIKTAVRPGKTRLVWIETPANPLWTITDIAGAADIAHGAGARLGVDSTVATPVLTRPLSLGADIVMHSATKYLNGHSDVLAGGLVLAHDDAYAERVSATRSGLGSILGPFEAALLIRGMRTLPLRVRHQSASALALAEQLMKVPEVLEVLYPGLPGAPGRDIAERQMVGGFSGMLSIRVKGGRDHAIRTAGAVQIWKRATSLGGVESLIEHRASIEGQKSPCPADLLRLSVGLESVDDLLDDLLQALRSGI